MKLELTDKIAVIGAGSWGTTIGKLLSEKFNNVVIWAYEKEVKDEINNFHENRTFLPGIILPTNLYATNSFEEAVADAKLVILVTPSHVLRGVVKQVVPYIKEDAIVVTATKGIEEETLKLMSEILKEELPEHSKDRIVALSGPSFAREVAMQHPTAVVAASPNLKLAEFVQSIFATPYFRVYTSHDIIGVEMGGALKNVIAIATGISDGLGYGYNTRAAIITRGLFEIIRLAVKKGADPLTLSGLAGLGDLVLTCTGELSRNRMVGLQIGKGKKLEEILKDMKMVAEGVKTTYSAVELAKKYDVEMAIVEAVYNILYNDLDPREAVKNIMARPLKPERY